MYKAFTSPLFNIHECLCFALEIDEEEEIVICLFVYAESERKNPFIRNLGERKRRVQACIKRSP